jgi:hypothetical protein
MKITFSGEAGDAVSFDWNFLTNENTPSGFNDSAYIVVYHDGALLGFALLADTNSTFIFSSSIFNEETGYTTQGGVLPAGGTYTVGLVVFDVGDFVVDSGLLVDNFQINGTVEGFESGSLAGWEVLGNVTVVDGTFQVTPTEGDYHGLLSTGDLDGGEGGGALPEIVFYKQFVVDGEIGDDDTGVIADFGGADAETSLENLVFTLLSNPTYGQLILVKAGGDTSFLTPGDTFSSEDTIWWIATQDQIDAYLEANSLQVPPDVTFNYSVTDEDGATATAPVTITINDTPSAGTAEIAIDEDGDDPDSGLPGLPGGLEGGPGDLAGVGTTETDFLDYDFGFDGPGDVTFAALHGTGVEDENGVPVTAGGQALTWDWDGATHTLTALNEDLDPVLTLQIIDILTGEYKVSVLKPFDHPAIDADGNNDGPETAWEDDIVFDLTFVVTDGNGDSVNGSVKVTLNDDSPEVLVDGAEGAVSATVEEEELFGGNEDTQPGADQDIEGDFTLTTATASGDLSGMVAFGADGPGGFSLTVIENEVGEPVDSGLTSGGKTVWYVSDGETLTAFVDDDSDGVFTEGSDRKVFELTVNNTSYSFVLLSYLDHAADDFEDILTLDFSSYLLASDADGDTVTFEPRSFVINAIDDIPEDISPDKVLIGSGAGSSFTGDLDFFDNVGADREGDVTFAESLDGAQLMSGGAPVTSGGKNIYLVISNDGHTLTGYADSDDSGGFTPGDEKVFEVHLNPDADDQSNDLFTMEVFGDGFDTGAGETFDDFGQAPSGNTLWTGILGNEVDILLTAGDVDNDNANTSNVGFGVGNNLVGAGEVARIDFVTDLDLDPSDNGVNANTFFGNTDYIDFTQHVTVDAGRVRIGGITGGGTVDVKITAFDADDDPAPDRTDAADYQDDPIDPIIHTDIVVLDENGDPVVVTYITEGDPVPAGVVVQGNADGSVTVYNMDNGWVVSNINTADGFSRLEIENVDTGGQSFRVTEVTFSTIASGEPIDLSFDVDVVDGDGDSAEGTIDVTVLPQQVGTDDGDLMTAGPSGGNLVGGAGDDTLIGSDETDLLQGGAGDDLIYGGGGSDVIEDGSGNDTVFSGDDADLIDLADDGETDVLVYTAVSEAGDTVTGFDVAAPNVGAAGGDVIDIAEVLAGGDFGGGTLQDAIDDGYVTLIDNGGNAEVWVDLDGTAGAVESPVLLVTLNGVDIGDLNDNNVVVD